MASATRKKKAGKLLRGDQGSAFVSCPQCFASVAAPLLPWHLPHCHSSPPSLAKELGNAHAPFTPATAVKNGGASGISSASGRENPLSSSPVKQEPESLSEAENTTLVQESHPFPGRQPNFDSPSLHYESLLKQLRLREAELQQSESALTLSVSVLTNKYEDALRREKELEMKCQELLTTEQELRKQLAVCKNREKEALSLVELYTEKHSPLNNDAAATKEKGACLNSSVIHPVFPSMISAEVTPERLVLHSAELGPITPSNFDASLKSKNQQTLAPRSLFSPFLPDNKVVEDVCCNGADLSEPQHTKNSIEHKLVPFAQSREQGPSLMLSYHNPATPIMNKTIENDFLDVSSIENENVFLCDMYGIITIVRPSSCQGTSFHRNDSILDSHLNVDARFQSSMPGSDPNCSSEESEAAIVLGRHRKCRRRLTAVLSDSEAESFPSTAFQSNECQQRNCQVNAFKNNHGSCSSGKVATYNLDDHIISCEKEKVEETTSELSKLVTALPQSSEQGGEHIPAISLNKSICVNKSILDMKSKLIVEEIVPRTSDDIGLQSDSPKVEIVLRRSDRLKGKRSLILNFEDLKCRPDRRIGKDKQGESSTPSGKIEGKSIRVGKDESSESKSISSPGSCKCLDGKSGTFVFKQRMPRHIHRTWKKRKLIDEISSMSDDDSSESESIGRVHYAASSRRKESNISKQSLAKVIHGTGKRRRLIHGTSGRGKHDDSESKSSWKGGSPIADTSNTGNNDVSGSESTSKGQDNSCLKNINIWKIEHDEHDDSESSSLSGFIVSNSIVSFYSTENTSQSRSKSREHLEFVPETSCPSSESIFSCLREKVELRRKAYSWEYEADMLAIMATDSELCLRAVCALYRQQTLEEQQQKGCLHANKRGFDRSHASRASLIAEFLTDGDSSNPVKKSVQELEKHDSKAVEYCRHLALHHSKQLFAIYQNKEDPHFPFR